MTCSTSRDEFGIERGGDLVEQHQLRVEHQRAGDGDTLLLAARELGWIGVGLGVEAEAGRGARVPRSRASPLGSRPAPCRARGSGSAGRSDAETACSAGTPCRSSRRTLVSMLVLRPGPFDEI